jgi:ABC-type amino acid transport substrate-binding protein
MPPGLHAGATTDEQMDAVRRLIRNIFLAHTKARAALQSVTPGARAGTNPLLLGFPPWLQNLIDARAARVRDPKTLLRTFRRFTERAILEHGEADVAIAQLTMTQTRGDRVSFSESYFVAALALLVRADGRVSAPADLAGKRVAVVRSTTGDLAAPDLLPDADSVAFDTVEGALRALDGSAVSAVFDDDVILAPAARQSDGRYRLLDARLRDEPYGVAVARGNRELLDTVDDAIKGFKADGSWERSVAAHVGTAGAPPRHGSRATLADLASEPPQRPHASAPQRSARILRTIERRGYLVAGIHPGAPGLCARTASGGYEGLEIDVARRIARVLLGDESKVRFRELDTPDRIGSVRSFLQVFDPLLRAYGILFTLLSSNWWYLGMQGRLADFLCPKECVGALDFVGIDYYWGLSTLRLAGLGRLFDAANQRYSLAPVQASLLYDILRAHAKAFPAKEMIVVENGCVDSADGITRERYLREHILQVQRAVAAGIPVSTYICWSITSNREWGAPFGKDSDFGLFHINLDGDAGLRRDETPASRAYRDIVAKRDAGG